jgi:ATP synthase protein I
VSDREDRGKQIGRAGVYVTIPFILAVPPILGWILGSWGDRFFGSTPYLAYVALVLGMIAGFREVYRLIKRFGNDE